MIVTTICKLLLALGVGCYLSKKEILTEDVNQKLSYLVLNVCLPLLILTSLNEADHSLSHQMMTKFVLIGLAIYAVLPFLSKLLNLLMRVPKDDRPVYELFYIFSNNMFMGFPVAASLFGSACIFQLCIFNLGFDLLYYTYGIGLISRAKGDAGEKFRPRELLGTGTLASATALIMFFCQLQLPEGAAEVCNFLGELSSPLSMLVIGANIGAYSFRTVFGKNVRIYLVAVIRLLIFPALTYVLMTALGFDGILRGTAVISMGMPTAAMVSMGCIEREYKPELASSGVILTTLLSIPLIPVMLAFLS